MPRPPTRHPVEAGRAFSAPFRFDAAAPRPEIEGIAGRVECSAFDPPAPPLFDNRGGRRRRFPRHAWGNVGGAGIWSTGTECQNRNAGKESETKATAVLTHFIHRRAIFPRRPRR